MYKVYPLCWLIPLKKAQATAALALGLPSFVHHFHVMEISSHTRLYNVDDDHDVKTLSPSLLPPVKRC